MKSLLSKYFEFSDTDYNTFIAKGKLLEYKKGDYLLRANEVANKLFFIKKGFVRGFRLVDGKDTTHFFYRENWFATDYESYLEGSIGEIYLQALLDTTAHVFDKNSLYLFFEGHKNFEKIRYIIAEHAYLQMVRKFKNLQTNDLKERYKKTISENPELFNLVPQKYIASYLGVEPQSLSRLKKTIKWDKT